jgi:hypothetical protein
MKLNFAPSAETSAATVTEPRVTRLLEWRQNNAELHHQLRVAGIRRSSKVREVLQRNHTGLAKRRWLASLIQNPKFQPTDLHVAAKSWVLRAPNGSIHTFRNLRNFIRENEELFDAADVIWKAQTRRPKLTWCQAYQSLARLRPGRPRTLDSWNGWTWAAEVTKVALAG